MTKKQKKTLIRIGIALGIFLVLEIVFNVIPIDAYLGSQGALYAEFALFLVPYLIAGYDVLLKAGRGIAKGQVLDENFLMAVATIGAFALVAFPDAEPHFAEGSAVMLFYQVGEWFQGYAVGKSRKSIADLMDIAPEFANIQLPDGTLEEVDPYEVEPGSIVVIKPGERVPLDGVVLEGTSSMDTSALTGESMPRETSSGMEVISGCINLTGALSVQVTKPYEDSTVSRILELVENASEKKAQTENFITRFARYYTPIVVGVAVALAILPPLMLGASWSDWIQRALIFLVVSCPCALVISVPLSFFGGIGGASRQGILVKGSNYLEALAAVDTVVFDKTGTLTTGKFAVTEIITAPGIEEEALLEAAAMAELYSNHPIALSIRDSYEKAIDLSRVKDGEVVVGKGVIAYGDGKRILAGNEQLLEGEGIAYQPCKSAGTVVYVSADETYLGCLVVADVVKEDAASAITQLHASGVTQTVMLTGDKQAVAKDVASRLGLDTCFAELLPQDKVGKVEELLARQNEKSKLAFVGDGINDAPVLTRADIGIAMGAMGSDAAIEAADIVLMDDKPSNIALAIKVARKTMRIVWQNIIFAIGVKILILVLAAIGLANMWLAVFGDVGVAVIAILNAMRAMSISK